VEGVKPVLTPDEMAAADRRAIAAGTAETVLVERAGRAVARHALQVLSGTYGRRAVVVCGKGNNGADGRVAARVLRARGVGVDEFALADGIDGAALQRAVARADLAIDAMFGTGFRGRIEGDASQVVGVFDAARATVLAVDIPSGVDGATGAVIGPAVTADATVCFAAWKPGLLFEPGRSLAGRVELVDIGIDAGAPDLHVLEERDLALPRRVPDAHKWSSGLFVIGGSTGMTGAPVMASRAAARSGAGMVVCGLPGRDAAARASADEIVTRALPATEGGALAEDAARAVLDGVGRFRAVAIGPGLGRDPRTQTAIGRIVAECPVAIVVDADGLNALAADAAPLRVRHTAGLPLAVLTPHAGEYERLAGEPVGEDRVGAARKLAARTNAVVLLKGPGTVIAHPHGDAVINRTDSPALATAGTGDVLTGIIGGLIADGAAPYLAAATGAHLHGLAAHVAGTAPDLVASDLIAALHPTLELLRSRSVSPEV
jgi:ADP-dependent NAD(P)H-hydrate dehydratase / NAD(P)H-hydrate epimerase